MNRNKVAPEVTMIKKPICSPMLTALNMLRAAGGTGLSGPDGIHTVSGIIFSNVKSAASLQRYFGCTSNIARDVQDA